MGNTVFGIDFGAAYSSISYVDKYDKAVVINNSDGNRCTPSVVYFDKNEEVIVGEEAQELSVIEPQRIVRCIKNEFSHDAAYDKPTAFPNGLDASEIASFIFKKIVDDANNSGLFPEKIKNVVITCPAYFGAKERMRIKAAAELAGLAVEAITNEPNAALLAYGVRLNKLVDNKTFLIYDLGATFDVTVMRISGAIYVIATGGDRYLGGANWDIALAEYLLSKFNQEHNTSYEMNSDPILKNMLLHLAENKKKQLGILNTVKALISYEGKSSRIEVTHDIFDALTEQYLDETIEKTKEVLDIAKQKGFSKIDEILLIGGGSRMSQVKTRIDKEFNFESKLFDPEECVAKGAVIYAIEKNNEFVMCYYTEYSGNEL